MTTKKNPSDRSSWLRSRYLLPLGAAALLAGCGAPETGGVSQQQQSLQVAAPAPGALRPRAVQGKPQHSVLSDKVRSDLIVVKFHEGTRVREASGKLRMDAAQLSDKEQLLLQRAKLDRGAVESDLSRLNSKLDSEKTLQVRRLFSRPVEALDIEKQTGEAQSGEELADLNNYYSVSIEGATKERASQLIDQLNAMNSIEIAYAQPLPQDAAADIAPTTSSYVAQQGYLNPAPQGIDAEYAWTVPGAKGEGIKVIDVERSWHLNHEDLPAMFFQGGTPGVGNHGTAVLGEIVGAQNSYGVTGIAPEASVGVSTVQSGVANAINAAAGQLSAGDVILIEQHAPGPDSGETCSCNCDQFEYIAMEYWQAEYDAVRAATTNGIVVVEAGGNGSMNLDAARYGGRFNRAIRDSGAIVVGAGTAAARAPECWTNYGSRVDVQGWGDSVTTLGYGTLAKVNGEDVRQWYSNSFSGTSSASPIVTGAVLAIQGVKNSRQQAPMSPTAVRTLLRNTGTAQAASAKQIGPLPDLKEALDSFGPPCYSSFHNLKASLFQGCFDYWVVRGRWPVTLTAYQIGGITYMAGSFQAGSSRPVRHLMTSAQYQANFDNMLERGWRPASVSVVSTASGPRFTAIWAPIDGQFESRHGMTEAQFDAKWPVMKAQGFAMVDFVGYDDGGQRFGATWVKKAFVDYIPQEELTSAQYNAGFAQLVAQGYQTERFSAYQTAAGTRYAVLWKKPRGAFYHYYNMTGADYQAKFNELGGAGYRVYSLNGLADRLSAIWVKP